VCVAAVALNRPSCLAGCCCKSLACRNAAGYMGCAAQQHAEQCEPHPPTCTKACCSCHMHAVLWVAAMPGYRQQQQLETLLSLCQNERRGHHPISWPNTFSRQLFPLVGCPTMPEVRISAQFCTVLPKHGILCASCCSHCNVVTGDGWSTLQQGMVEVHLSPALPQVVGLKWHHRCLYKWYHSMMQMQPVLHTTAVQSLYDACSGCEHGLAPCSAVPTGSCWCLAIK
jgi:hypothetical protein